MRSKPPKKKRASSHSHDEAASAPRSEASGANSLSALTRRNVELIGTLEEMASAHRSHTDRLADAISQFVGSMACVYIHVAWFAAWIAVNSLPIFPAAWRIDPFPFTFLTLVVSLEAIFLSTFILISQNHEERVTRRRSHLDLQINLLAEQENSQILKMLETIQHHLHIKSQPDATVLEEGTRPEQLVAQIQDIIEESHGHGAAEGAARASARGTAGA